MGKYNFDTTLDHTKNNSFRWEQVGGRSDIIGMGTADLDYFCPPCIRDVLVKIAQENTYNYRMRSDEYYNAVMGWYKRGYDLDIKKEWIFSVPSTIGAVCIACDQIAKKGDGIIVQMPCFGPIQSTVKLSGYKMVENPMKLVNGKYEIDFEDFEQKIIDEKPSVFLMVNPHNPTGKVYTKAELEKLVDICYKYGVKIVSDEVHSIIIHKGYTHTPILSVSEKAKEISLQIISLSKGYNLMSLPHAMIFVPDEDLRAKFADGVTAHSFGYATNSFAIAAVTTIMSGAADEWLKEVTEYIEGNTKYAMDYCEKYIPKLKCVEPEGSFLLWADCSALNIPKEDVAQWFVDNAGITLDNGYEFGEEGAGFIRINLAVTKDVLVQAMKRLEIACK